MGFAASVARVMYLTGYKHDLGSQIDLIQQNMLQINNAVTRLLRVGSVLSPDTPEGQIFNQQRYMLAQQEKMLNIELERKRIQHKAVITEIESVQKTITEEAKTFKLMAGA